MNESNMENEKTPLYVAFSTQKGGVGKTTFTVLAASYLYYLKGYDVAVVDCDYPQHSIAGMRKRDAEQVGADARLFHLSFELGVPFPYPCQCGMGGNTIIGNQCVTNISNLNFSHF